MGGNRTDKSFNNTISKRIKVPVKRYGYYYDYWVNGQSKNRNMFFHYLIMVKHFPTITLILIFVTD